MGTRSLFLLIFFFCIRSIVTGQEVLTGLYTNPQIVKYVNQEHPFSQKSLSNDTLELPFFDDFSKTKTVPDADLWIDQTVFINSSYAYRPLSIGVATFDAIDASGKLYPQAGTEPFSADKLTSKPINLFDYNKRNFRSDSLYGIDSTGSNYMLVSPSLFWKDNTIYHSCADSVVNYFFPDTILFSYDTSSGSYVVENKQLFYFNQHTQQMDSITESLRWQYYISDSLFLSFYYQPQGLGHSPEAVDSLVLEFFLPDTNAWIHVWGTPGTLVHDFKQVLIPLDTVFYLQNGFQFRFRNYATLGDDLVPSKISNNDMWNLDYIFLDTGLSMYDTVIHDVAIQNPMESFLAEYESVPWQHYVYDNSLAQNKIVVHLTNNDTISWHLAPFYDFNNITENIYISERELDAWDILPSCDTTMTRVISGLDFDGNTSADSSLFEIRYYLTTDKGMTDRYKYRWNDTSSYFQTFYNYYAYDDGSAEKGYGIVGDGSSNAMVAYQFTNLKEDTLRAVQMYFNRTLNDASNKYFYLYVWEDLNGKPGDTLYTKIGMLPIYSESMNEFQTYRIFNIDTATHDTIHIVLPIGTFYVGWRKTTEEMLNVGFDVNRTPDHKLFYNVNGQWMNSSYAGAIMVRVVMGKRLPDYSTVQTPEKLDFVLFPNPAKDQITIKLPSEYQSKVIHVSIYNQLGNLVKTANSDSFIVNVSNLSSGVYIVRVWQGNQILRTKRLIIVRD